MAFKEYTLSETIMGMFDSLSDDDANLVKEIMDAHGFGSLKKTQKLALRDGILDGGNHLLVAETGNGKTLCAEAVAKKTLHSGGRVAYLVPSRQLIRDKRDTIREWSDSSVLSGNGKYGKADIAVATFDSFYRALLRNVDGTRGFDCIILDDFHEIYGGFRGPDIEKAIAAVKYEGMDIFAMSATIGNPDEIGEWLDADVTVSPEGRQITIEEEVVDVSGNVNKKQELASFVKSRSDKAPFLIFNYAKSWTETRASAIADTGVFRDASSKEFVNEIKNRVDGELTETLEDLGRMMNQGVAFHHSGLPSNIKHWIEDLYESGDIQCLCATTTIAYGFDAPVKTVVVADIQRGADPVGVWEYVQWIGRAARPGYGYEKGYSYTFSNDPDDTQDRYFEGNRTIEPVTTHVESNSRFRRLLLELIETGWNTPDEIELFVQEMLYWEQMNDSGAWGREFDSKEERLKNRLRETATWLESNGFVRERQTSHGGFGTTKLGTASVDFLFDLFGEHDLTSIKKFYEWIQVPREYARVEVLEKCARLFNQFMSETTVSDEFESYLRENSLSIDKPGITAGIIENYWIRNVDTRVIEEETDIDATYLPNTAKGLAEVLEATGYFFDAAPNTLRPDWFSSTVTRVKRGVRQDEVPFVENVRGLGRYRVRSLRDYLNSPDVVAVQDLPDGSLWEQLNAFYEENTQMFEDVLHGNVSGIGPKTASKLSDFVANGSVEDEYLQTEDVDDTSRSSSNSQQSGFQRATSLDEYTD